MSIIIKGMDMPKGFDTRLRIINDGEKATAYLLDRNYTSPLEFGEVIEIPTPHGRLIDADDFIDVCEMLADKNDDRRPFEQAEWIAKDMQTILEAERE